METRTFNLTKKYKLKYLFSGIFLLISGLIGYILTFRGVYSIIFTILVFLVSSAGLYMSVFYLLSPSKTHLNISESRIEFVFPFGCEKKEWENIKEAEISPLWFRLYFEKKPRKKLINLNAIFFYKENEIPIYIFIDNWQGRRNWEEEPLLILINKKLLLIQEDK